MIEADPPLEDAQREALEVALRRAGVALDARALAYESAWRQAGAREAVRSETGEPYAPSPRKTRGATRA